MAEVTFWGMDGADLGWAGWARTEIGRNQEKLINKTRNSTAYQVSSHGCGFSKKGEEEEVKKREERMGVVGTRQPSG